MNASPLMIIVTFSLNCSTVRRLQTPRQHAIVASTNEVIALISAEGYWSTLAVPLNHETGCFDLVDVVHNMNVIRRLRKYTNRITLVAENLSQAS